MGWGRPLFYLFVFIFWLHMGSLFPDQGWEGCKGGVLTPGPPRKSQGNSFQIEPFGHIPLRNCQKEYPRAKALGRQRLRGALPCRPGEGGAGREGRQELPREAKPPAHVLRHWEGEFPAGPVVENLPVNAGDMCSIPGQGRSQSSEATNPMCHNY